MIDLILSKYRRMVAENKTELTRLQAEEKIIQEASDVVTDRPDKDNWVRTFGTNEQEKGFTQALQMDMVKKAREFSRFDPNAKGALTTMVNYIMGKGLSLTPKADDPMVWYVWREFWTAPRNRMALKQFEIVGRSLRDGEIFIRFFTENGEGAKTGKTTIRFLDPLLVRARETEAGVDASKTINNGVVTDPEDVEKVLKYTVRKRADTNDYYDVPADEMLHIKVNVDSDQKRGETQLLSVMDMFTHYRQWIENRIILNKMRSAIVLVRSITGTPDEVAAIAANTPDARNTGGLNQKKNFRGGTILNAGAGVKYEMLAPNINATDVKEDGRNIKTNMAAGLNIPEYVFGDASNQNYASSLIAESPFVKSIQYWQIFYEFWFSQIFRKVIQNAVDAGLLIAPNDEEFINKLKAVRDIKEAFPNQQPPKPDENKDNPPGEGGPTEGQDDPIKKEAPQLSPKQLALQELMPNGKMETPTEIFFGCDMDWPEIVHRDMKAHAEALAIATGNGWMADSTACSALGYDYAEEVRKARNIEEDSAVQDNPLKGTPSMDNEFAMDAEMQDMLDKMSPEERDKVLRAKDPREVVRIMNAKKGAEGEDEEQP